MGESEESKKYKSKFQVWFKRIDERIVKPWFIYEYKARQKEITKSKKLLKMNNTDFDPTQFGRLTVLQHQGYKSGIFKSGVSSKDLPP